MPMDIIRFTLTNLGNSKKDFKIHFGVSTKISFRLSKNASGRIDNTNPIPFRMVLRIFGVPLKMLGMNLKPFIKGVEISSNLS